MADTTEPGAELEPIVRSLPAPRELSQAIQDAMNGHIAVARADWVPGDPEQVHELVRWLAGMSENLREWGRAFASGDALAQQYAEEILVDAVGEQDGMPASNYTVPDIEGDVQLERAFKTEREFDEDALLRTVAQDQVQLSADSAPIQEVSEPWPLYEERYNEWMTEVVVSAIGRYLELGSFTPQVSKVTAYAKQRALRGEDAVAAQVRKSVTSRQVYGGTRMGRRKVKE